MRNLSFFLALTFSSLAAAQPLPPVAPEAAGFTSEGLARIDRFFAREVADERMPGAVLAIARDGKLVHFKAYGYLNKATGEAMPLDAIFQMASMTKVMASVGGLALNEEGRLPLKSRLDEYFPAFAKKNVGTEVAGEIKTEPAKPIYLHDLFRHTSGIPYGSGGDSAMYKLYPPSSQLSGLEMNGDEFINRLAPLPLLYQPGTVWEYGLSTDVLGLVIEKVTGKRLGEYLQAAVWNKVRMPDTFFNSPDGKLGRIARPFDKDPINGQAQRIPTLDKTVKFDCAGGCAYSSVGDYLRFAQMLLNGGAIDGRRVLSPKTVAAMTSNHLGPTIRNMVFIPEREGYGFGLGVAVRLYDGVAAAPGSKGDYIWTGGNGTIFWVDPQEKLVVVFGAATPGRIQTHYREQLGAMVYGALSELRHAPAAM